MDFDFSLCTNRFLNMDLKWIFYHRSNWLCISKTCFNGIAKHLEHHFIRENNFLLVVMQMFTCPGQANVLCSLGQERHFFWKNRDITKIFKLTLYCTLTNFEFRIIFFQFSFKFACSHEMVVFQNFPNMVAFFGRQFSWMPRWVIYRNITSFT